MSDGYVGEVRLVPYIYAPRGWFLCQGQPLQIKEYQTLFEVIGAAYGGDGSTTFQLPDLRGRVPIHKGTLNRTNYTLGQSGGVESVTLDVTQTPAHNHVVQASASPHTTSPMPTGNVAAGGAKMFTNGTGAAAPFNSEAIGPSFPFVPGGNLPHENRQPFLVMNWIIATTGLFPTR